MTEMKKVDKRSEKISSALIFEIKSKNRIPKKTKKQNRKSAEALRVIRAETRLTVYCSLSAEPRLLGLRVLLEQGLRAPDRASEQTFL